MISLLRHWNGAMVVIIVLLKQFGLELVLKNHIIAL